MTRESFDAAHTELIDAHQRLRLNEKDPNAHAAFMAAADSFARELPAVVDTKLAAQFDMAWSRVSVAIERQNALATQIAIQLQPPDAGDIAFVRSAVDESTLALAEFERISADVMRFLNRGGRE